MTKDSLAKADYACAKHSLETSDGHDVKACDSLAKAIAYLGAVEVAPRSWRLEINAFDYPNTRAELEGVRFPTRSDASLAIPRQMNYTSVSIEPSNDEPNVPGHCAQ